MRIQTILALTDFSSPAEQALERAALLAAHHQARLQLLYIAERQEAKFCDPQARLEQRARQLSRRHQLTVQALPAAGDALAALHAAAAQADLLVMDNRLHGRWRWPTRALGLLARMLRTSPCPVLVVQGAARAPYVHVLVHAAGDEDSGGRLLHGAAAMHAGATVELFHVARPRRGLGLACGEAFARALRSRRQRVQQLAQPLQSVPHTRLRVSDAFETRRNRVGLATRGLDPARQLLVQQQGTRADLLVLAHAPRGVLRDLLQAGKAWRLLAGPEPVGCDVLLMPQRGPVTARPEAAGDAPARQSAVARRWTQAT
ncbi:Nucleotide-binding universal stress protein, UspA family [Oryzisolibacter propanilivorax]|uniref:Nucleotide-binding universal stress protein, UspA family n=1 Tax=Oryzisolibacter propanilivorax TaxID=1527607 RepID=A0A1G9RLX7_9BURK|nr:universal stress protein [Oryzisolibacter propanilivorax]SDM23927.1 Nucleotide-binding universal stress protein, UspA family [Oryzisolibacter propanilivorax]